MLVDSRELPSEVSVAAQVCVVGGGAAGITLALDLARGGVDVVLLESGGIEYEGPTQLLYDGYSSGPVAANDTGYLLSSRLRHLGGSSNHWAGWCRPLDPEDFSERAWLPGSGWPFGREELDPWYDLASPLCDIWPFRFRPEQYQHRGPYLFPDGATLRSGCFHLSAPTRFARKFHGDLAGPGVRVLLHANALALRAHPDGSCIERVDVGTLSGRRFAVAARHFVLAAGGIENPRLLLLSDDVHRRGLGNEHDRVGRYFMDHPHLMAAHVVLPGRVNGISVYAKHYNRKTNQSAIGYLQIDPRIRDAERLPNAVLLLMPRQGETVTSEAEVTLLARETDPVWPPGRPRHDPERSFHGRINLSWEPVPDPLSRVTLGEERDALGLRKVALDWRLGTSDEATLARTLDVLSRELGHLGLGRLRLNPRPEGPWQGVTWSNHHIGTTRMHRDPRRGVVDADCRVHGLENLWIAGSSVFPTAGCFNPTLTILALALRLGARLRKEVA